MATSLSSSASCIWVKGGKITEKYISQLFAWLNSRRCCDGSESKSNEHKHFVGFGLNVRGRPTDLDHWAKNLSFQFHPPIIFNDTIWVRENIFIPFFMCERESVWARVWVWVKWKRENIIFSVFFARFSWNFFINYFLILIIFSSWNWCHINNFFYGMFHIFRSYSTHGRLHWNLY